MKDKKNVLRKLFLSTLYLSAFTFGGGYVIVTLMKKKFVDQYHWIEEDEMLDLVAIAQSAPGPIAVNGAIVVGYKLAGLFGVAVAILGTIIPPFVIIALVSVCYNAFRSNVIVGKMLEGMQSGVAAVIASVTYEMGAGHCAGEKRKFVADHGGGVSGFLCLWSKCGSYRDCVWRAWSAPGRFSLKRMLRVQAVITLERLHGRKNIRGV